MFFLSFPSVDARRSGARYLVGMCAISTLTGIGHAQITPSPAAPAANQPTNFAPQNSPTSSPSLPFGSVLQTYKPMTDQKLGSWRDANDTVTRIGGWRAYLKESQQPEVPAPAAPTTVPAAPAVPKVPTPANSHAGHGGRP